MSLSQALNQFAQNLGRYPLTNVSRYAKQQELLNLVRY